MGEFSRTDQNGGARKYAALGAFAGGFRQEDFGSGAGADTRALAHLPVFSGGWGRSVSKYSP
ncbi:MAG TPA: hypothetical protein DDZ83_20125 [Nitrospinae bacterium]|nr:hypothetical protein [Nitrospinota bacterium]